MKKKNFFKDRQTTRQNVNDDVFQSFSLLKYYDDSQNECNVKMLLSLFHHIIISTHV
jgi:hypothetical protein